MTGVLCKLHLSKSGYYNYLHRKPSKQSISKKNRMQAIQTIYDNNHQIYGAPKIAKEMQKKGEKISQRTVGVYMREMGIKACDSGNLKITNLDRLIFTKNGELTI